jgi:superfamily II DNA or RNA helicase
MKFRYDKSSEEIVVTSATRIEYHQLNLWLTRFVKGYKYIPAFKMGVWNGQQSYFKNGRFNFGLWREAMKGCKEIDASFILENKEDFPLNREVTLEDVRLFCREYFKFHKVKTKTGDWIPFTPYDHQVESAYKILKNRYCMAEVATSGGKSLIISIVMFYTLKHIKPDAKFLIIVPSITLVTQFYDNILEYNWGSNNLLKMKEEALGEIENKESLYTPCEVRVEEVMSEKPRKYSGTHGANVYIGTYQSLEKWPKEFFQQFHTVITDEAHGAKSKTITTILQKTFKHAYSRFGVSGTFPEDDTCEILTIQAVLGPKITEVSAYELKEKGIITPMEIKAVIMNHADGEFNERIKLFKKAGAGKDAYELEKAYIHISEKRLDFIKKIVEKCETNTLLLFHTIDYGQKILKKLETELSGREYFYIDGEISGKKREEIKKRMEVTKQKVEWSILNFGDHKLDFKSDTLIPIKDGGNKLASDITPDDQIDTEFIKKFLDISETRIVENKKVIKDFGTTKVLVASYGTLSTGVSINAIFNVIFADSFKSEQIIIQSIGRALRLHTEKEKAKIFDLVDVFDSSDMSNILFRHFKERERFYEKRKYPYKVVKINL